MVVIIPKNRMTRLFFKDEHLPIDLGSNKKVTGLVLVGIVVTVELIIISKMLGTFLLVDNGLLPQLIFKKMSDHTISLEGAPFSYMCIEGFEKGSKPPYGLKPNCSTIYTGSEVLLNSTIIEINSDSYRGKLYSEEKPEGVYRIIVLGDSFTFGSGVNINGTFPYIIEQMLNNGSKTEYQVINLGVPGYGLEDNCDRFLRDGVKYNPDLVILTYLSNDLESCTRTRELMEFVIENIEIPSEFDNYLHTSFLYEYVGHLYQKELSRMNYSQIENLIEYNLRKLSDESEKKGFDVILFFWNVVGEGRFLINYAKEQKWEVIRVGDIKKYAPNLLMLHPLDGHPTQFFNGKVAEIIYEKIIENILKENW